mmetsp:Transcript_40551/g.88644  ORF Transcript_40551/g.88644 Transcript_40551/m.88644 type:complete len:334 (-) Transcript_40551:1265-2266(-)
MPQAVLGLHPVVEVAARLELVRPLWLQLEAKAVLDLLPEPLLAVVLHSVLDARMLPASAVAEVPLHGEDGLGHKLRVTGLTEADDLGEPGVGLLVVVGEAQSAANSNVEALQLVVLDNSDEAQAVCKDVNIIGGRDGHSDLVLAGQVGEAVQGLLLHWSASQYLGLFSHLIAVHEEDLMVCATAGQAVIMHGVGVGEDLLHHLTAADRRVGGAHDIPANIAACRQGVHAGTIHRTHRLLHVALEDPMDLPGLPRGDLQRPVRVLVADVVHGYPLLCSAVSPRHADADHEAEGILDAQFLALLAKIPVILLVAAVGFDELGILEGHLSGGDIVQ